MMEIARSADAPASLAERKQYDGQDVKERLLRDFLGKCYLTEECLTLGSLEIDHFRPKAKNHFPELAYDWKNLFPTSHNANIRRPKNWPDGGLLDPSTDQVERRLLQRLETVNGNVYRPQFSARDPSDIPAKNTADQLEHIHNDQNLKAADLRQAIHSAYTQVLEKTLELQKAIDKNDADATVRCRDDLRRLVSRRSSFAMLVRSRLYDEPLVTEMFD